jgi:phenylalanyl-tRNA synthetase beta chain
MGVPRRDSEAILSRLGFEVREADDAGARVVVPSWRQDVTIEEDLVEEIVRSVGYDSIPETLPAAGLETPSLPAESEATGRVRDALEGRGFCEAVSFSFVAPGDLSAFPAEGGPVVLRNPISAELAVMRTSLLPSLLRAAAANLRQRVDDVRLYEVARTYADAAGPGDEPAREATAVAGVMVGRRAPQGWAEAREPVDFYDAKAAVERVAAAVGIDDLRWEPQAGSWGHPRLSGVVRRGDDRLGAAGELHPRVAAAFGLPRGVLAFELDLAALLRHARLVPRHAPIPRFPAVLRDLAVVVAEDVPAARVVAAIRAEPLVEAVTLFDVYTGPPIPAGRKNLALALRYRSPDRTLTDPEVDAAHARIVERLSEEPAIRAELRG